uniref:Charged multivesicular body protein 3-like n=1 Tax=Phallusia mammillata TaxID=59560 RepID=A0A6F9D8Q3_9ASCI|nr:charged multivesicular body protein 3-like [Phallusia mammillata]
MGLFGKTPPPDPREKGRQISSALRKEQRVLDRQIRSIQREEEKVKRSLKEAAKKGDKSTSAVLAKEIVHSRKAISRIHASKAQINSIDMSIKNQVAMARVSGAFEKSTEVMKMMQSLVKVGEVRNTMMDLSKEMMKMGIMEEMMEDTFESLEGDDMEDAAQDEIDKVLHEITAGVLGKLPDAEPHELPSTSQVVDEVEDEEEEDEMQQRLEALRS